MSVLDALHRRNSHARLNTPAPDAEQLQGILTAGLRAPDHGRLRPWHFTIIAGEAREQLGMTFEQALLLSKPTATDAERQKARLAPLRAPLIIAGMLKAQENPKVPRVEQAVAVGCALHSMQLAADALGFAGIWRTGTYARDPLVISALKGSPGDEVIGFLYLGTAEGEKKPLCPVDLDNCVSYLAS